MCQDNRIDAEESQETEDSLSLDAMLLSRAYLYTLFHKLLGMKPTVALIKCAASSATADALDQYEILDDSLDTLFEELRKETSNDSSADQLLRAIESEYGRFFVGPGDLPAVPFESPYITGLPSVFQPSTLVVRRLYRKGGYQMRRLKHVPDDHISSLCQLMAELSVRARSALHGQEMEEVLSNLAIQRETIENHLLPWVPQYAEQASNSEHGFFYPIWIETLDRFCKADCAVAAEAEEWVREHVYQADRVAMLAPASFEKMEAELRNLAGMRSMGLDDVELVHVT